MVEGKGFKFPLESMSGFIGLAQPGVKVNALVVVFPELTVIVRGASWQASGAVESTGVQKGRPA